MRIGLIIPLLFAASSALADSVVATGTIRANTILTGRHVTIDTSIDQGLSELSDAIGMETRVVLYAGRPILPEHLMSPARVERNEIVPLVFHQSGLSITTNGRVLDRGAIGETVRVMNLASRATLFGVVLADGSIDLSTSNGK